MTGKELREYIPIMPIEDPECSCVCSKRGDITFGWRLYLPVAFSVNEAGYDSIIDSFMRTYRLLPSYCVVHKQDIFRYDVYRPEKIGEFLGDSYEKKYDGWKYLNGYCYLFLTFSSKSVIEIQSKNSGFFHMFSAKPPKKDYIEKCAAIASQFEDILSNNQLLSVEPLQAADFIYVGDHGQDIGLIPDYVNLFSTDGNIEYNLEPESSYLRVGDKVAKAWYVEDSDCYPPQVCSVSRINEMSSQHSEVFLSGGSPFGYQLKIPHIVNRYIVTLPKKELETELNQRKKLMTSFSLFSPTCRVNAEELEDYLDICAREGNTTIKCFTDIIAWGSPSEMNDIRNKIVTAFSNLDMVVAEERENMPLLHYAGIPGAAAELGYDYLMTSEMNGFLCHGLWDGYDSGVPNGAIKLCDRNRMVPIRLDIQRVARAAGLTENQNSVVVGPSGSGKSFTMNKLVECFYNDNQHILIIDVGDSYQGLCQIINEETGGKDGIYNTYDPQNPLCFNPFKGRRHWGEVDEDGEQTGSGLSFFLSLVETMYQPKDGWTKQATGVLESIVFGFFDCWDNGYTEEMETLLREAYINVRRERAKKTHKVFDEKNPAAGWINPLPVIFSEEKRRNDPIFDDFYQYVTLVVGPLVNDGVYKVENNVIRPDMFDADNFGVAISKYKKGGLYGFLLNAETEKDFFASRLTVYEVDKIKDNEDLFPLWILSIMHSFEDKMRSLQCQKVMIIEEAWSAIAKPTMANYIVWLWRTARKFSTSAIVVTQSLGDLMSSPIIKDAIVQNSSVKILLDQRKNAAKFEETASTLAFSPLDVGLVLSVNRNLLAGHHYKEAFFSIGVSYSNVFAVEVSLEEALAFESDKVLKKPVFELAQKTGSIIEAIKIIAEQKRKETPTR